MPDLLAAHDIERAVIGTLLQWPDDEQTSFALADLEPDAFDNVLYREAYRVIREAWEQGEVDAVTVMHHLSLTLDEADWLDINETWTSAAFTSPSALPTWRGILREKYNLRRIRRLGQSLVSDVEAGRGSFDDLLSGASVTLSEIAGNIADENVIGMKASAPETYERIIQRAEGQTATGIPTSFELLDKLTSGWQKKNSIIVAGHVGQGKSALAIKFGLHAAREGYPVCIFSLEMNHIEVTERLYAMDSHVEVSGYRPLKPFEKEKLLRARDTIGALPLFVDTSTSLTIGKLAARAKMHQRRFGIKLFVVDYLQLLAGHEESRQQQVEAASRGIKRLAGDLDVPFITISQFSRKAGEKENQRPKLSDLRDSGAIEQDANVVLLIHEPEEDGKRALANRLTTPIAPEEQDRLREIIVAKNRSGKTASIPALWAGESYEFRGLK